MQRAMIQRSVSSSTATIASRRGGQHAVPLSMTTPSGSNNTSMLQKRCFFNCRRPHQRQAAIARGDFVATGVPNKVQNQSTIAMIEPSSPSFIGSAGSSSSSQSSSAMANAAASTSSSQLTYEQIKGVMVSAAIPMIGFGFMDNLIMIQAGSYIDSTLGVKFGLTTLTAAAMGQVVSDVSGVTFGNTIEKLTSPYVKPPLLSEMQRQLPVVSRLRLLGAVSGVMLGCMLGATSLLLLPQDSEKEKSIQQQMEQLGHVVYDLLQQEQQQQSGDSEGILRNVSCKIHMKGLAAAVSSSQQQQVMINGGNNSIEVVSWNDSNDLIKQCAREHQADSVMTVQEGVYYIPVALSSNDSESVAVVEFKCERGSVVEKEAIQRIARYIGIFMKHMAAMDDDRD